MNITLIGMPASGKSTIGVLLAKRLGYQFIDTDLLIQTEEKRLLKEIIQEEGLDGFLKIENKVNASVEAENAIIAPGGSVIYGKEAMEHLKAVSTIVYLKISYVQLEKRLGNLVERGVAVKEGMTLLDLYEERVPLYETYADIVIDEQEKDIGSIVDEIRTIIENRM